MYWRIGAGIATLWWASRPRRSGTQRMVGGLVGLTALAAGVTGYSPIMDALGMEAMDINGAGLNTNSAGLNTNGAGLRSNGAGVGVNGVGSGANRDGINDGTGVDQYLTESSLEDIGTASYASNAQQTAGRTIFRIGDYAIQKMPGQSQRSLWGVPREHDGVDYPASVTPDSSGWSWDEMVDNE